MRGSSWQWKWRRRGIQVRHGGGQEGTGGPVVKLRRMAEYFPDYEKKYNIIYACYGFVHRDECRDAKRKGIPVVYHMNSCGHPAYGVDYQQENQKFQVIHNELADYIVYGSQHAQRGAQKYLGQPDVPSQIIYNGVNVDSFIPSKNRSGDRFHILIAGRHDIRHRIEPMLKAMLMILDEYPQVRLTIAGELHAGEGYRDCQRESFAALERALPKGTVEWHGAYTQNEAPDLYRSADVLVHLKHMDWTPNVVAEAMACGLPVVYAGNGGMQELVGDAGVGLNVPENWEEIQEADPECLAAGVIRAWQNRETMGRLARERAEQEFSLQSWIEKHLILFRDLI
ncbi:MAG: glycosyltransferase family 4 protein [Verrucomicrobiota bacterium]